MEASDTAATRVYTEGLATRMTVRVGRLRIREPDRAERTFELRAPIVRVGTRAGNDLVLHDDLVSRIHLELAADDRGYRLRDLGSTNGTAVDGFRAADLYLRPGAVITAGRTQLVFELSANEVSVPLLESDHFGPLLGASAPMRRLYAVLERVAPTDATVLVEGESGTGKELVARAVHEASKRVGGPYVVFDCASVAENLLESELFGHERGAFTGAVERRIGCLEQADGGTLFLDELGELPLGMQSKLLRALENREVRRVGGQSPRQVDVRFVAATNRDLAEAVNNSTFREDLYYRLAVVRIVVPPLRERREDIPRLVRAFVERAVPDPERAWAILHGIEDNVYALMAKHPWPGNVRELRNAIERSIILGGAPLEGVAPQPPPVAASTASFEVHIDTGRSFPDLKAEMVSRFEAAYVRAMLERCGGKITPAAALAGINRTYFNRLVKKHGL